MRFIPRVTHHRGRMLFAVRWQSRTIRCSESGFAFLSSHTPISIYVSSVVAFVPFRPAAWLTLSFSVMATPHTPEYLSSHVHDVRSASSTGAQSTSTPNRLGDLRSIAPSAPHATGDTIGSRTGKHLVCAHESDAEQDRCCQRLPRVLRSMSWDHSWFPFRSEPASGSRGRAWSF